MKLSCTNRMVPGGTLREQADLLRQWSFDAIAVQADSAMDDDALVHELLAVRADGTAISEFSLIGPHFGAQMGDDPEVAAAAMRDMKRAIAICSQAGANTAIGYEYRPQSPLPIFESRPGLPDALAERFAGILDELLELARPAGVPLVVEAINRYETRYLNTLDACAQAIARTRNPQGAGLLADTFHLSIEEASIPAAIQRHGAQILQVHLGDNNRMLPGQGGIDWAAVIGALRDVGYSGYLSLECGVRGDPARELPLCAAYLRRLMQE